MNAKPLLALLALLAACAPARTPPAPVPLLTTAAPVPQAPVEQTGSLFDAGQNRLLFDDDRARRVGDIVLVRIVESANGGHNADTTTERNSTHDLTVDSFFGNSTVRPLPFGLPSFGLKGKVGSAPILSTESTSKHEGTGETTRQADLTATVGVRVISVQPGGLLEVEGARQMRINEENQILVVKGLLRSRDIGPDNAVTSDRLANATIEFYGQGVLADKQRPGWLTRVLDNVWPF